MLKKLCIILLVFSILLPLLSGCAGKDQDKTLSGGDNIETPDSGDANTPETTERIQPDLPDDLNFNGETFTFLVTGHGYGYGYYETVDIYTEEQNGETLNDAVYIRNRNVEAKLNINIAEHKSDNVASDAKKAIQSGDGSYDAIFAMLYDCATMAQNKLTVNIKEIPHINLTKPWWDKNAENDLSVKNKLYFTTGDISTMVKACTRLIIFNKKVVFLFLCTKHTHFYIMIYYGLKK